MKLHRTTARNKNRKTERHKERHKRVSIPKNFEPEEIGLNTTQIGRTNSKVLREQPAKIDMLPVAAL